MKCPSEFHRKNGHPLFVVTICYGKNPQMSIRAMEIIIKNGENWSKQEVSHEGRSFTGLGLQQHFAKTFIIFFLNKIKRKINDLLRIP